MASVVSRRVAIWVDHHEAILLKFEVGPFDRSFPHRPGDGRSQYRVEAQQYPTEQQYYEAVLSYLKPGDEILILGPGQAKRDLCHEIERSGNLKGEVVGLQQATRLAEVELVFPTGREWTRTEVRLKENLSQALEAGKDKSARHVLLCG